MFDRSRKMMAGAGVALLATLGLGGAALAQSNGAQPTTTHQQTAVRSAERPGVESTAPESSVTDPDSVQYTAPGDPDYKAGTAGRTVAATSAPEKPGTEQDPAAEQPGGEKPGSEVPGDDGSGGHADEPGNANADHQVQGKE